MQGCVSACRFVAGLQSRGAHLRPADRDDRPEHWRTCVLPYAWREGHVTLRGQDVLGHGGRAMTGKRVLAFLVARPLIAVAIAAVVVGGILLLDTHKQTTPVTHRTEHVGLTDAQQMQLGSQQYARRCGKPARESFPRAPSTRRCSGSPSGSRPSPRETSRGSSGG